MTGYDVWLMCDTVGELPILMRAPIGESAPVESWDEITEAWVPSVYVDVADMAHDAARAPYAELTHISPALEA